MDVSVRLFPEASTCRIHESVSNARKWGFSSPAVRHSKVRHDHLQRVSNREETESQGPVVASARCEECWVALNSPLRTTRLSLIPQSNEGFEIHIENTKLILVVSIYFPSRNFIA